MTVTTRALLQEVLSIIGVYGADEAISDTDFALCLAAANDMLAEWNGEYLTPQQITPITFTAVFSTPKYSIALDVGADINAARPNQIVYGPGAASFVSSAFSTTTPADVVGTVRWNQISPGLNGTNLGLPNIVYYEQTYPLGTLHVAPIPAINGGGTMTVQGLYSLTSFAPAGSYVLPNAVAEAVKNNLAIRLKPLFPMALLDPAATAIAQMSLAALRHTSQSSKSMIGRYTMPPSARQ